MTFRWLYRVSSFPPFQRIRSFLRIVKWVIRDGLSGQAFTVTKVTFLDLLGASAQGVLIGFISILGNKLESDAAQPIPYTDITIDSNITLIVIAASILFLLLIISAWASYRAAINIRVLGRLYHQKCARRTLKEFSEMDYGPGTGASVPIAKIQSHTIRNPIHLGKFLETIVRILQPSLRLIVVIGSLIWLDPKLAFTVLPAFVFLLPIVYRFSSVVQNESRLFFNQSGQELGALVQRYLQNLNSSSMHHYSVRNLFDTEAGLDSRVTNYFDSFDAIQLADERMQLRSASFRAFIFSFSILVFGAYAIAGDRSWSSMAAFMGGLLFTLNSLQGLTSIFVTLNRFYPQVRDYHDFLEQARNESAKKVKQLVPDIIKLQIEPTLDDSLNSIELQVGNQAVLWTVTPINRAAYSSIVIPLVQATVGPASKCWSQADLVSADFMYYPDTIRRNFGVDINDTRKWDDMLSICDSLGVCNEIEMLESGWDTPMNDAVWRGLSPMARATLRLVPATQRFEKILFVDYRIIDPVTDTQRSCLFSLLEKKHIILVSGRANVVYPDNITIIILENGKITGIGHAEWFEKQRERLASIVTDNMQGSMTADDTSIIIEG